MAPKAFSKDYLLDKLDELWVLRENMHVELDWSYECRLDQLKKKVMRQLIDPHEMEKQRLQYEFVYTTCVQNLETSHENLSVLQSTVEYLCEQSPYDHPSTHAHFQDVVDNLQLQEDGLHQVRDHIRACI